MSYKKNNFAEVIVDYPGSLQKTYSYIIPISISAKIGQIVEVPFGSRSTLGIIKTLNFYNDKIENLKYITRIINPHLYLTFNQLKFAEWISTTYNSDYFSICKIFFPVSLSSNNIGIKFRKYLKIKYQNQNFKDEIVKFKNTRKHKRYLLGKEFLNSKKNKILSSIVKNDFGVSAYSWAKSSDYFSEIEISFDRSFIKKNIFNLSSFKTFCSNLLENSFSKEPEDIGEKSSKNIFIEDRIKYKLSFYKSLIQNAVKNNSLLVIFCPDVFTCFLLYQFFFDSYSKSLGVVNNATSKSYRHDLWLRVKAKRINVIFGTYHAAFLPFVNIDNIVIHDYNDESYKQNITRTFYDSRKVIEKLSNLNKSTLFFITAIPDLISTKELRNRKIFSVKQNEKQFNFLPSMKQRISKVECNIIDMRQELRKGKTDLVSEELKSSIYDVIKDDLNVFLFTNRIGKSYLLGCDSCSKIYKCDNCDVNLVLHTDSRYGHDFLLCHYCGFSKEFIGICDICKKDLDINIHGGTQAVYEEMSLCFQDVNVFRIDSEVISNINDQYEMYMSFNNKYPSIIIGNRMSLKFGSLQKVALSAHLSLDSELNLPNFKSSDNAYRSAMQCILTNDYELSKNRFFLQTFDPDHYVIKSILYGSMKNFYSDEMKKRKQLLLPPFSKISRIILLAASELESEYKAENLYKKLVKKTNKKPYDNLRVLGPYPSFPLKLKNQFRFEILIKGTLPNSFLSDIKISNNIIFDLDF